MRPRGSWLVVALILRFAVHSGATITPTPSSRHFTRTPALKPTKKREILLSAPEATTNIVPQYFIEHGVFLMWTTSLLTITALRARQAAKRKHQRSHTRSDEPIVVIWVKLGAFLNLLGAIELFILMIDPQALYQVLDRRVVAFGPFLVSVTLLLSLQTNSAKFLVPTSLVAQDSERKTKQLRVMWTVATIISLLIGIATSVFVALDIAWLEVFPLGLVAFYCIYLGLSHEILLYQLARRLRQHITSFQAVAQTNGVDISCDSVAEALRRVQFSRVMGVVTFIPPAYCIYSIYLLSTCSPPCTGHIESAYPYRYSFTLRAVQYCIMLVSLSVLTGCLKINPSTKMRSSRETQAEQPLVIHLEPPLPMRRARSEEKVSSEAKLPQEISSSGGIPMVRQKNSSNTPSPWVPTPTARLSGSVPFFMSNPTADTPCSSPTASASCPMPFAPALSLAPASSTSTSAPSSSSSSSSSSTFGSSSSASSSNHSPDSSLRRSATQNQVPSDSPERYAMLSPITPHALPITLEVRDVQEKTRLLDVEELDTPL